MKTIARTLTGFVTAGILLLPASATSAQQNCGPRDHALGQLENRHHEHAAGRGLTPDGEAMFELFVSKSGSWTVLVSDPNGRSCVVAVGESWDEMKPPSGDPV